MQVTFLQDHQSYLSGNSFYAAGAKADFPNVAVLVEEALFARGGARLRRWHSTRRRSEKKLPANQPR